VPTCSEKADSCCEDAETDFKLLSWWWLFKIKIKNSGGDIT
jgi:hypothetical protein